MNLLVNVGIIMKFHEILKFLCEDRGLALKDLAGQSGISLQTLYALFERNRLPSFKICVSLCNFFDCSIDFILGLSQELTKNNNYNVENFVKNYKNLLVNRNISHYKVCQDTKLDESRFYDWQRGKLPYLSTIITLANYFKISVDELIG